jgi:hypothetical protein
MQLTFDGDGIRPYSGDDLRKLAAKSAASLSCTGWTQALASSARTTTTNAAWVYRGPFRKIQIVLTVTSITGTGVRVAVLGLNPNTSQSFYLAWGTTAITATGTYVFNFGENASNGAASGVTFFQVGGSVILSDQVAIQVNHTDASSVTYQVDYILVPVSYTHLRAHETG